MFEEAQQQVVFREGFRIIGFHEPLPGLRFGIDEPLEKMTVAPRGPGAALTKRTLLCPLPRPVVEALDLGRGRDFQLLHGVAADRERDRPVLMDEERELEGGVQQVVFPGGDGWLYAFEAKSGELLWKCDCLPTRKKKGGKEIDNSIVSTPVVLGDKLYVGLGLAPEPPRSSRGASLA